MKNGVRVKSKKRNSLLGLFHQHGTDSVPVCFPDFELFCFMSNHKKICLEPNKLVPKWNQNNSRFPLKTKVGASNSTGWLKSRGNAG